MSRSLNKVMLIGNVGKDPEMNFTPSGVPVATLRLATTETWKDKEGNIQEHTDWHTVIAWRGLADIMHRHVHRGSRIYVEGKIQNRVFDDNSGTRRYYTEIMADNLLLLDGRQVNSSTHTATEEQQSTEPRHPNDDIPF